MGDLAVRNAPMTFQEAAQLDPEESPGELDGGRWVPVTRNSWRHGMLVVNVASLLKQYAREHKGWSVSAGDPGTKLGSDPDILRGPDVAIVQEQREPAGEGARGWLDGAPDLAVEIMGERQSASGLTKKALEYLKAGGQMVWVLDPGPERLMIFTAPNQIRVLSRDDELDVDEVLPGFRCKVADLFE